MLLLTSTSDLLRIVTSAAATIEVQASWADKSSAGTTPGRTNTAITTATTTTIVGSPAASTQRNVGGVTIRNAHASTPCDVTVTHTDGTTAVSLVKVTLAPGETLQYKDGWSVLDALGNISTSQTVTAVGSDTQVMFNDGGNLGGDAGLTFVKATDVLLMPNTSSSIQIAAQNATPAAPSSGRVGIFGRTVAKRSMLAQVGPSGLDTSLQPLLARNKIAYWNPPGNATTVPGVFGLTALTAVGTATARNVATTNLASRMRRVGYPSPATAGSLGGVRLNVAQFSCGSGSNDGSGFWLIERWVESDPATVSGRRAFTGVTSSTSAPTNVEPNTLTNVVGVGQLSTDATQWYWVYGGSSAQTAVAIGTSLGAPAGNSTTAWELAIFCPASVAATYYLQLTNLTTGATAETTLNGAAAVVPQSGTLLAWSHWVTNNATALAVGMDLASLYIETDF